MNHIHNICTSTPWQFPVFSVSCAIRFAQLPDCRAIDDWSRIRHAATMAYAHFLLNSRTGLPGAPMHADVSVMVQNPQVLWLQLQQQPILAVRERCIHYTGDRKLAELDIQHPPDTSACILSWDFDSILVAYGNHFTWWSPQAKTVGYLLIGFVTHKYILHTLCSTGTHTKALGELTTNFALFALRFGMEIGMESESVSKSGMLVMKAKAKTTTGATIAETRRQVRELQELFTRLSAIVYFAQLFAGLQPQTAKRLQQNKKYVL